MMNPWNPVAEQLPGDVLDAPAGSAWRRCDMMTDAQWNPFVAALFWPAVMVAVSPPCAHFTAGYRGQV